MKKIIFLVLFFVSFSCYASFPVVETLGQEIDPLRLALTLLNIVLFIFIVRKNKRKYGKWYRPWSTLSKKEKVLSYIGLGFFILLVILMVIAFQNPDGELFDIFFTVSSS